MGRRGPPPKSHALRVLEGTDKYQTEGRLGDLMPSKVPAAPDWLEGERELAAWASLIVVLTEVPGLIAAADQQSMARYCCDLVEYAECREQLKSEGRVAYSEKGSAYQHPLIGIRNKCHDRLRRFESLFGMTAADRARIEVPPPIDGTSDLEGMIA